MNTTNEGKRIRIKYISDKSELEKIVQSHGMAAVLYALREICDNNSEGADIDQSRQWKRCSRKIDTAVDEAFDLKA